MARITHFDHVGLTVADLDAALDFFVSLGFELEGRMFMEGEFVDTVIGIPGSRSEIATLFLPEGGAGGRDGGRTKLELSRFVHPDHEPGSPQNMSTEVGLRNIAFQVDDLHAVVERLAEAGYGLVGGIGEWEDIWRMTYVRGPEGIIVALAQRLDGAAETSEA
ncbi:VOC family protein [Knoellia sp. CPCC 206450]|uniref:VOC family protein n=1 Tax=Knoellia tibetensis TaxID=3404798 RepID=UPI003B438D3A